ncbi:MAG: phosphate acyltransferase, partial [Candidatus Roizmanbacteria bacterium]|nr:phosphate acyltransferase [Candidatus Roizmanbacteria bacterium]
IQIKDFEVYKDSLEARLGKSREVMRVFIHKARKSPKKIVFPEGEETKILRAAQIVIDEGIAHPILIGDPNIIKQKAMETGTNLEGIEIINPVSSPKYKVYLEKFYEYRKRKGITHFDAERLLKTNNYYGMMMVREGDADGLISGLTQHYPDTVKPALQIIGHRDDASVVAGLYMLIFKNQIIFIADATINIEPNAEQLAQIAMLTAEKVRKYDVEPNIAMLSFSNFGSVHHPLAEKVRAAVEIVKKKMPNLNIDGEMQADTAVTPEILSEIYPFSSIKTGANVLICPDLTSANIAYKLLARLGGATAVGPILMGIRKPVYLLIPGNDVSDIVNITAMAVQDAQ